MNHIKTIKKICVGCKENNHNPGILMEGGVIFVLVSSLVLMLITMGGQYFYDNGTLSANISTSYLVQSLNEERADADQNTLVTSPILEEAAALKAHDMATKGYFAHTSPEGVDPWHWFREAGYDFEYAGENLAVNYEDSQEVNDAWMDSPTHQANMLNEHFTEVGIATEVGEYKGEETIFVVQLFGKPKQGSQIIAEDIVENVEDIVTSPVSIPKDIATSAVAQGIEDVVTFIEDNISTNTNTNTSTTPAEENTSPDVLGESDTTGLLAYVGSFVTSLDENAKYIYYTFIALISLAILTSLYRSIRHGSFRGVIYGVMLIAFILTMIFVLKGSTSGEVGNDTQVVQDAAV